MFLSVSSHKHCRYCYPTRLLWFFSLIFRLNNFHIQRTRYKFRRIKEKKKCKYPSFATGKSVQSINWIDCMFRYVLYKYLLCVYLSAFMYFFLSVCVFKAHVFCQPCTLYSNSNFVNSFWLNGNLPSHTFYNSQRIMRNSTYVTQFK